MNEFEEEQDDGEGWLVSYADLMTLIACFFILMMAFANYDPVGFSEKAEELAKHFRKEKFKSAVLELEELNQEIAKHEIKERTKISLKDSELIAKFSSSVLFENGSAEMKSDLRETLDALIEVVKITNPHYRVLIEGHADDDLEGSGFDSEWELSAARAAKAAKRFELFGFPKDRIVPLGKGDSEPLVKTNPKDKDFENKRRLNRRIVIRLLEPYTKKKMKFGLGIYFKDSREDVSEDPLKGNDVEGFEIEN